MEKKKIQAKLVPHKKRNDSQPDAHTGGDKSLLAQLLAHAERSGSLQAQLDAQKERNDALQAQADAYQEQNDVLRAQVNAQKEQLDALQARLAAEEDENDVLKVQLEHKVCMVKAHEYEIKQLKLQVDLALNQFGQLQQQTACKDRMLLAQAVQIKGLNTKLKQTGIQLQLLTEYYGSLKTVRLQRGVNGMVEGIRHTLRLEAPKK